MSSKFEEWYVGLSRNWQTWIDNKLFLIDERGREIDSLTEQVRVLEEACEFIAIDEKSVNNFWSKAARNIILNGLIKQGESAKAALSKLEELRSSNGKH